MLTLAEGVKRKLFGALFHIYSWLTKITCRRNTNDWVCQTLQRGGSYFSVALTNVVSADHQHRMVRLIQQGKLGLAPVKDPKNVVDVCTGTGIWAIEYGKFREALSTGRAALHPPRQFAQSHCF